MLTNNKVSLIFIAILLASCANESTKVYDTVKLPESYKQKELIIELEKNNVDFYLNQDGSVSYNTMQTSLVDNITKSILKRYSNGIQVLDADYEKLISGELAKEEIKFKLLVKDRDRWVMWGEKDHKKVEMVLDRINSKSYRKEFQFDQDWLTRHVLTKMAAHHQ